jgi:hypothetical protein
MRIRTTFTVLAAAGFLALGCNPTLEGQKGNLEISYEGKTLGDDEEFSAIAVGGKVDYYVGPADPDEERTPILQTASSSNAGVLEVTNSRGTEGISEMTVTGVSEGAADITVDAEYTDGSPVSDVFPLEAKEPDAMTLDHTCGSADVAGYLASNDGMFLEMEMFAGDRRVVGYDYHPVAVSPSDRVSIGSKDRVERLPLESSGSAGEFTVSSELDDSGITGRLVEKSAIDRLVPNDRETDRETRVDSPEFVDVLPVDTDRMSGGEPLHVCQAGVQLEASTTTPDICTIETYAPSGVEGASEQGVEVEGLQSGTCQVEVSMANASGVTGEFEVTVE